jgi:hypothetical protein
MVPLTPPKQPVALLKHCSASSYGTFGIGLRATKSLTASIGRQSRQLTECQAGRALYVELHCLEGALKKKKEENAQAKFLIFSNFDAKAVWDKCATSETRPPSMSSFTSAAWGS